MRCVRPEKASLPVTAGCGAVRDGGGRDQRGGRGVTHSLARARSLGGIPLFPQVVVMQGRLESMSLGKRSLISMCSPPAVFVS